MRSRDTNAAATLSHIYHDLLHAILFNNYMNSTPNSRRRTSFKQSNGVTLKSSGSSSLQVRRKLRIKRKISPSLSMK